jgi:hypothetical protein
MNVERLEGALSGMKHEKSCGRRFRGLRGVGHGQQTDASLSGMASSAVHRVLSSEASLPEPSASLRFLEASSVEVLLGLALPGGAPAEMEDSM